MKIGVLALQGDFAKHQAMLTRLGAEAPEIRLPGELKDLDGLVVPGGESTTFSKLMKETGVWDALRFFANSHPIFGTCAGLIILANELVNQQVETLRLLDVAVQRNAYGRQRESFVGPITLNLDGDTSTYPGVFIRAPKIVRLGKGVQTLGRHGDDPVLVRSGNILAATFHPELTDDTRIHAYFIRMVEEARQNLGEAVMDEGEEKEPEQPVQARRDARHA
ncbi:MAG TPA: pyridoxal 5'-phosphate synthase glutaminase subunit PdxT [Bacteroidetes bacterium]|nr:pyridoxal 5'-phosphate synthase glutaminase subunit PdxT [Bacteroidota bacterium]